MKITTKIFLAVFVCLTILGGLSTTALAKGYTAEDNLFEVVENGKTKFADSFTVTGEEELLEESASNEDANTLEDETDTNVPDTAPEKNTENKGDEENNDFEELYKVIMNHISEILSLAAFIGSLICAIIYKSGLMPLMENGLKSLKNAATKIKEATDKAEFDNKESIGAISSRINNIEDTVTDLRNAFLALTKTLEGYQGHMDHQKRLDTVLEGELDMLYDIFMTSALPEYEKTRVGERMTKLKEALNSGEKKN